MRKLLFALAVLMTGAFAFAAGSPASAASAGAVSGLSDVVKSNPTVEKVYHRRRHYYRHHYYRRHHYRPYWRPRFYFYRPYWRRHRHHHHRRHYYRW
jgi:hypothetical protein